MDVASSPTNMLCIKTYICICVCVFGFDFDPFPNQTNLYKMLTSFASRALCQKGTPHSPTATWLCSAP